MIQFRDRSIVQRKSIFMAQAKKGLTSLFCCVGIRATVTSLPHLTYQPTQLPKGKLSKFFINSTTGGIS